MNNVPVLDVEVNISIISDGGLTNVSIANDGTITVPAGTPAGTYYVTYQICDVINPTTNCDSAIITIVVTAPTIIANIDDYTNDPVNQATGASFPIYNNDILNGSALNPAEVTFSIIDNGGIDGATIDSQGIFTVPAGTPIGPYVVTYSICEITNPNKL